MVAIRTTDGGLFHCLHDTCNICQALDVVFLAMPEASTLISVSDRVSYAYYGFWYLSLLSSVKATVSECHCLSGSDGRARGLS